MKVAVDRQARLLRNSRRAAAERILVGIDLALGDRPGAVVLVLPERAAGMDQEQLRLRRARRKAKDAGAALLPMSPNDAWRIWKPPSSSAQRLTIASLGPSARPAPRRACRGWHRCARSRRPSRPRPCSGTSAASKARCAASSRSAGLKILPTPVSGIVGIGTTCTGTAARSGISWRQNSRSSSGVASAPGRSCTKAIGSSPA